MVPYLVAIAAPAPLRILIALAVGTGVQGSYYVTLIQSALQALVPADLISRPARTPSWEA